MKFINHRLLIFWLAVVLACAASAWSNEPVAAQDPGDIQIGVIYKCDNGSFKVLTCDDNQKCRVHESPKGVGGGTITTEYKDPIRSTIRYYNCKPESSTKPAAKTKPTPEPETETEPDEKPAPKKKPETKPSATTAPQPEPEEQNDQKKKDDPGSAEPAPAAAGPQFAIGDCVQVDGGQGVIKRADGDNFYVDVNGASKRVPFSSASKMKKATGCGN